MGELRRIVCQKKYLLAVFVLLIANLFLFQYYQMDNLQALRDKETRQDTLDVWQEDQETAKEEFVSKIKEMDAQSETLSEISIFSDENYATFILYHIQKFLSSKHFVNRSSDRFLFFPSRRDQLFYLITFCRFCQVNNL